MQREEVVVVAVCACALWVFIHGCLRWLLLCCSSLAVVRVRRGTRSSVLLSTTRTVDDIVNHNHDCECDARMKELDNKVRVKHRQPCVTAVPRCSRRACCGTLRDRECALWVRPVGLRSSQKMMTRHLAPTPIVAGERRNRAKSCSVRRLRGGIAVCVRYASTAKCHGSSCRPHTTALRTA